MPDALTLTTDDEDAAVGHQGKPAAEERSSRSAVDDELVVLEDDRVVEQNADPVTLEQLFAMSDSDPSILLGAVNKWNKEQGYRTLHVGGARQQTLLHVRLPSQGLLHRDVLASARIQEGRRAQGVT